MYKRFNSIRRQKNLNHPKKLAIYGKRSKFACRIQVYTESIDMNKQEVIICQNIKKDLSQALEIKSYDKLFVLTDEHTFTHCLPLFRKALQEVDFYSITIPASDVYKTIDTLAHVWKELSEQGASRRSLLINLGGGMITDLGGFAASTFKRGIRFINIPTTLLAMVDAAVGGKNGINFNGLKNEVGVFNPASAVLIETDFLSTLDNSHIISGYAEMLKHGLISNQKHWAELLQFDLSAPDLNVLKRLVAESVQVKERIVEEDPYEKGIRKALNFGHTVGHAFESLALELNRPVEHGYAVAWGMICELYLSAVLTSFPQEKMRQTIRFIRENWGHFPLECKYYERLYELMTHDKKNENGVINITLLEDIGSIRINETATQSLLFEMFDFYRENGE